MYTLLIECVNGGKVLDAAANGNVIVWGKHGGSNQLWRFEPFGGEFLVTSVKDGRVLDLNVATGDVIAYKRHGGPNQRWRLLPAGKSEFLIVSGNDGRVLDLKVANGDVIAYKRHGGPNQRWRLV